MKKSLLLVLVLVTIASQAQEKKWTLKECVDYAIQNNISIQQTELDNELIAIDKKDAFGNFLPTANASASHSWNIGLNINPITNIAEIPPLGDMVCNGQITFTFKAENGIGVCANYKECTSTFTIGTAETIIVKRSLWCVSREFFNYKISLKVQRGE